MMARMVQYVKEQGKRIRAWHDRHPRTALFVLVSSIGMFASATPALAQLDGLSDLTSALGGGIFGPILALLAALMYAVVQFLILLNSMFADMLISFVQYNTFVDARPVQIGWPLIRDVVNMLFIVVLLAVAFSTIIGYEKLHYKHILPKLLLMAVLINFSKTLVGVMIDFSQVITLTFVNGFKAAAFGNFAKAFSLPTFLDTMKGNNVAGFVSPDMLPTMGKVIISLLFGIVVLTVTSTVLLIMTVYFVARIVILWVVLIFSPVAFFAWAVHGTPLEKALHSVTGEWSSKLTAALTGGPVVAFFLWLTLAVIQGADKPFDGLYKNSSNDPATSNPTILDVSRPENMTTMLVAIALLLTGLNTAVSVSSSLDKTLGGLAGKIKSAGGPAGLAARYIAKPAAGKLDRKLGISKKFGEGLIGLGQGGGLVGGILQRAGMKATAISAKRKADEKKAFEATTSHESDANKLELAKTMRKSGDPETQATGEKMMYELADKVPFAQGDAILQDLAATAQSGKLKSDAAIKLAKGVGNGKKQAALIEQEQKKAMVEAGLTEAEMKDVASGVILPKARQDLVEDAKAKGEVTAIEGMRTRLANGLTAAEKGDEASFNSLMDIAKKNQYLHQDPNKRKAMLQLAASDESRIQQNVDPENWEHTESFDAVFEKYGDDLGAIEESTLYEKLNKGKTGEYLQTYMNARRDGELARGENMHMTKAQDGSYRFAKATVDSGGIITASARGYTPPVQAQVATFSEAVQGLKGGSTGIRTTLESNLKAEGADTTRLDTLGKSVVGGGAFTAELAAHVNTNAKFYASPPVITPGTPPAPGDLSIAAAGQAKGIYAPSNYRVPVMSSALTDATIAITPDQKKQGVQAFVNTDIRNFSTDLMMQGEVFTALDGRMAEVRQAIQQANGLGGEIAERAQTFVQTLYSAAQKIATQPPSPAQQKAFEIKSQMDAEGVGKLARRGRTT